MPFPLASSPNPTDTVQGTPCITKLYKVSPTTVQGDPCLSALEVVTTTRYTNRRILYFTLLYFTLPSGVTAYGQGWTKSRGPQSSRGPRAI